MPDTATRELLKAAFDAGRDAGWHDGADDGIPGIDFDDWYATPAPLPLPTEPPDRAICPGTEGDLWQRRDDWAGNSRHWFRGGHGFPYGAALDAGLDPARRLIELPDPDDQTAVASLAAATNKLAVPVGARSVRAVVRALAERGQQ